MHWLRQNFDTAFIVLQVWVDGLVIVASCFLGFQLYYANYPDMPRMALAPQRQILVLLVGVTLVCFWACAMYRWRKSILNVEEYRATWFACLLSLLVSSAAMFFLREDQQGNLPGGLLYDALDWVHGHISLPPEAVRISRVLFLFIFAVIFLLSVLQRSVMFHLLSILHARGFGNTNVAVYGTGEMAQLLEQKLKLFPTLGFRFIGFLDDDPEKHGRSVQGFPVLGGREQLDQLQRKYGIKRVMVAAPEMEEDELQDLCTECERFGIDYQVMPRLHHFFKQRFTIDNLDGLPLLSRTKQVTRPLYLFSKRLIDIVVSAFVLIVFSWFFLLTAYLIRRESPGRVLFSQLRVGRGGRGFRMLKFRTMFDEMCGDTHSPQSSEDPRVTRIGRFLRSSSLDELPQFINVLRGEMSLVGPRPEMPFIVERYSHVEERRLHVKPGITGLWQVSEARRSPIHENLDYDLYYIENQSLFLDLVILILTAPTVLRIRGV